MRIPFPERVSLMAVSIFATLVCLIQLLEGTNILYSLCSFSFILLAGIAFNIAGGLTTVSGGYIFFFSTLTGIVGWVVKDLVGEAADSNLSYPTLTAAVYAGTMFSMTMAIYLSKKIMRRKPVLRNFLTDDNVRSSVIGLAVIGLVVTFSLAIFPHEEGSFLSFVAQINNFSLLAVVIGVTYEVRISGGTRSMTTAVAIAFATPFVFNGLIGFTKEGMFTPPLAYLVAAAAAGYRFSVRQVAAYAMFTIFLLYYMVPYSQYGRNLRVQDEDLRTSFFQNVGIVTDLLSDLGSVRTEYLKGVAELVAQDQWAGYFDESHGIFDRLNMIKPDDGLIAAKVEGRDTLGLFPLLYAVYGAVPHFVWPAKPFYYIGNLYGHEVGMVGEDDYSTGISFSPAGEAYHMDGWRGVFVVAPIVFIICFAFFDSLCGDVRQSPWGLLALAYFAHSAPEHMLAGALSSIWHFGLPLAGAALICAYVMPILGTIIAGPQKAQLLPVSIVRRPALNVSKPPL